MNYKETINLLSKEFKVRPPKLIEIRGKRSWYMSRTRTIKMGKGWDNWQTKENTLLHEFAHHLEYCRNGGEFADKASYHSVFFVRCLVDVVLAYYGSLEAYDWSKEYKQVQRIYNQRFKNKIAA